MLLEFETISSCWTCYGTDFFLHFYSHLTMRVALLSDTETVSSCWTWYATDVSFLFFYRPNIRVAMLLEFETISKWRTWYDTDFVCIINLTEQGESPRHQTLKQNPFAELGMLLIFIFLFCHPTIRFAMLLELETISSCWTWYGTGIFFPFLSPHYQIHCVIRVWNNIKLLDLVWFWFFSAFLTSPNNEGWLVIRH